MPDAERRQALMEHAPASERARMLLVTSARPMTLRRAAGRAGEAANRVS
jgi:hypothetical protein